MSQCFTNILFTDTERSYGNEVMFEANRLQYASNTTKVSVVKELAPIAVLMIDDVREIFNLAPLPNGEGQKVLQSLNYINANIADSYQSNGDAPPPPKGDEEDPQEEKPDESQDNEGGVDNGDKQQ